MKAGMNRFFTGFIFGLLFPLLAFSIFAWIFIPGEKIISLLDNYIRRHVITHVISLSVLINLLLFFCFLWLNKEKAARGVIGATFLYAFLVLILKLS